jgi:predicted HD phosphohydrolase
MDARSQHATFTAMADARDPEQWAPVAIAGLKHQASQAERVLEHLRLLAGDHGGYAVDRLTHSLQTATRAHRDGRDEEYVVCALLHDIGDTLGSYNHADVAAAILKPFVSEQNLWIVEQHAIFQGWYFFGHMGLDPNLRDRFRDHRWFRDCAEFCARYDQNSFDPAYDTMPLETFAPMVQRVFARPVRSIYRAAEPVEAPPHSR